MIKPGDLGYFVDIAFLKVSPHRIEDSKLLSAIQTALYNAKLRIDNIVSRKEFMIATRSVDINRYVRVPNRFLAKYDPRVFNKNVLESMAADPGVEAVAFNRNLPRSKQASKSGIKIESNVTLENAYFHNCRYMSAFMVPYPADNPEYLVLQVKYNYKLQQLFPQISDATAYTALVLSNLYNIEAIYARAGSFARSEEYLCYIRKGKIASHESGNDTCIGYIQESKISQLYGININDVMAYLDESIGTHFASDDVVDAESAKLKMFERYKINKPSIYKRLDTVLDHWFAQKGRDPVQVIKLVKEMLVKEATLPESDDKEAMLGEAATSMAELIISEKTLRSLLYSESNIRDFYFKVDNVIKRG